MDFKKITKNCSAIKIIKEENGKEKARAYLYIIHNDLHKEPWGWLEDVFVQEEARGQGLGSAIVKEAIEEAKRLNCTKIVCASRHSKTKTHDWYKKMGFKDWGIEFRMDLD